MVTSDKEQMKQGKKRGNARSEFVIFNRVIRDSQIKKELFEEKMACFMIQLFLYRGNGNLLYFISVLGNMCS